MLRATIKDAAVKLLSAALGLTLMGLALWAAAPGDPETGRTVNGKVVDHDGKPVAGAEVWLPIRTRWGRDEHTAHAVCDGRGRFRLSIPQPWLDDVGTYERPVALWAFAPGHSLGTASGYRAVWGETPEEVVLTLGPATDTAFTVLGPDGRPLAGARVEPLHVKTPLAYEYPPTAMLPKIGRTTDPDGRVRLPAAPRPGLLTVRITAEDFGRQDFRLRDQPDEPAHRTLRLGPVGRIAGRIVTDHPEWAGRVEVGFVTRTDQPPGQNDRPEGFARTTTDDQGRFAVPALAAGTLEVYARIDPEHPIRPRLPEHVTVRPGEVTTVEIPLEPAVRVRGAIRVQGSGKPVAGAALFVGYGSPRQSDRVETDKEGRFEAYVLPGPVSLQVVAMNGPYVQPGEAWNRSVTVPADAKSFDLPTIEVVEANEVRGTLVDDADRPVADAQVLALAGNRVHGFAAAGSKGEFTWPQVPKGIDLTYEIRLKDGEPGIPARVVTRSPLVLRVHRPAPPQNGSTLTVRVVDSAGHPVEGAELILFQQKPGPNGLASWQTVGSRGQGAFRTDARGRFETPRPVESGSRYRFVVQPGTTGVAGSEWLPARAGTTAFPDLVVERLRTVTGSVVDRDGHPIAGANVLNWGNAAPLTSATTGADGGFRLEGVATGESLVFVEAKGYRFHGERIEPGSGPVRLVVRRIDQDPEHPVGRSIRGLTPEEARVLAQQVIRPFSDRALAGNDRVAQGQALEVLTLIDPPTAWMHCLAGQEPWDRDAVRIALFHHSLAARDLDEARAAAATIQTPYWHFHCLEELIDHLPADRDAFKKDLLAEAVVEARRLDSLDLKVLFLSHFARRLFDLGEARAAAALTQETLPLAKHVNNGTRLVIGNLARTDLPAAEALIPSAADERARNDLRGTIAEAIAASDPAAAERLIREMTFNNSPVFAVRACGTMAAVDLPRARRIAAAIDIDCLRGYALAGMADALATKDRDAARALLAESFAAFARAEERGMGGVWGAPAAGPMAGSLLPVVERIDPDHLDEYLWRTAALRWQPRTSNDLTMTLPDTSADDALKSDAALSLFLARYDPALARAILRPAAGRFLARFGDVENKFLDRWLLPEVLAHVEPRQAIALLDALPDAPEGELRKAHDSARVAVAKGLLLDLDSLIADLRIRITDLEILLREEP